LAAATTSSVSDFPGSSNLAYIKLLARQLLRCLFHQPEVGGQTDQGNRRERLGGIL